MKKLLMVSNGEPLALRLLKTAMLLVTGVALGTMFWMASTPIAQAQNMSPEKMLQAEMPRGAAIASASKADFLSAVCSAVTKHRAAAPQIAAFAVQLHPEWKKDILRTVFRCLGTDDCRLLGRVLRAIAVGDDASELTELAIELAPSCSSSFGGGQPDDGGGFSNAPGNLNPPPGSIGGGGGQGNVIAVCFNGVTRFFSPEGAAAFINANPGATLGACVVTPVQNR
ncbi:MAG: hypothetical protein ABI946_02290 [Chthoniobacterales bacterium]